MHEGMFLWQMCKIVNIAVRLFDGLTNNFLITL